MKWAHWRHLVLTSCHDLSSQGKHEFFKPMQKQSPGKKKKRFNACFPDAAIWNVLDSYNISPPSIKRSGLGVPLKELTQWVCSPDLGKAFLNKELSKAPEWHTARASCSHLQTVILGWQVSVLHLYGARPTCLTSVAAPDNCLHSSMNRSDRLHPELGGTLASDLWSLMIIQRALMVSSIDKQCSL